MLSFIFNFKHFKLLFVWVVTIILLVIFDYSIGSIFDSVLFKSHSGASGGTLVHAVNTEADIILTGSSRAVFGFDPKIFENNLKGKRVINAARNGSGIDYATALLHLISKKEKRPKYVFLEITNKKNEFPWIAPYKHFINNNEELSDFIISHTENKLKFKIANLSKLYKFNNSIFGIFYNSFHSNLVGGYAPYIPKKLDSIDFIVEQKNTPVRIPLSNKKKNDLTDFLNAARQYEITPIMVIFPRISNINYWNVKNDVLVNYLREQGVLVLRYDLIDSNQWITDINYYFDPYHLNIHGSRKLSNLISKKIATMIN